MSRFGKYGRELLRHRMEPLNRRIAAAIDTSGLMGKTIALWLGYDNAMVTKLRKQQRTLRAFDVVKFCEVVGCDLWWLLTGEVRFEEGIIPQAALQASLVQALAQRSAVQA